MKPPAALMANYENNQLIILFESEPKEPLELKGKVDFGIYDPTFYTAIDYTEDENMAVKDLPASCTRDRDPARPRRGDLAEPGDR